LAAVVLVSSNPTKRAPDAGDSAAFSSLFLRLNLFPIGRRPAARPSAGNANRWLAGQRAKAKPSLNHKFYFIVEFGKISSVF